MATKRWIERAESELREMRRAASMVSAVISGLRRLPAWIVATVRKARGLAGEHKQMQLVESLALGNRRQLLLVVCGGRRYLVGAGADGVGSIVAVEQGTAWVEQQRPAAGAPAEAVGGLGKGPELVRRRVRQIPPQPKPGNDRWQ